VYFQEVLLSLSVDPSTTAYSNSGPQGNPGKEIAQRFSLSVVVSAGAVNFPAV